MAYFALLIPRLDVRAAFTGVSLVQGGKPCPISGIWLRPINELSIRRTRRYQKQVQQVAGKHRPKARAEKRPAPKVKEEMVGTKTTTSGVGLRKNVCVSVDLQGQSQEEPATNVGKQGRR